ncbi:Ubiquinone/menaquinone biosynthesis C-methyltransferase UbiE [Thauera sp. GDN1]|uniref:class I SAM-dependent methyltransferase n=1 Tax=Thauera sp. GDN1 TaxID=2944810 RepID=UPI00247A60D1|nr:class I SAM-dependent methyltransferase [Thauera sp. GDN1]WEN43416.1 Ubiquinone/menaquinone biosynthesis C-methyltransferase UbiE [Thauera sp. GDN1]
MNAHEQEHMWSTRYRDAGEDYVFGTAPNRFLVGQAALLSSGTTALSVADGEGRNAVWLAEQGLAVTATEISPVALEKARKLAAGRRVEVDFVLADAVSWAYPEAAFDFVVAVFIQFADPAQRARVFAGMQRALKPGGHLIVQGYTPRQLEYRTGGPSAPENLYTADMLRTAFAGLEILHLQEYEDVLEEGVGHKGRSALVGLVARRPAA